MIIILIIIIIQIVRIKKFNLSINGVGFLFLLLASFVLMTAEFAIFIYIGEDNLPLWAGLLAAYTVHFFLIDTTISFLIILPLLYLFISVIKYPIGVNTKNDLSHDDYQISCSKKLLTLTKISLVISILLFIAIFIFIFVIAYKGIGFLQNTSIDLSPSNWFSIILMYLLITVFTMGAALVLLIPFFAAGSSLAIISICACLFSLLVIIFSISTIIRMSNVSEYFKKNRIKFIISLFIPIWNFITLHNVSKQMRTY